MSVIYLVTQRKEWDTNSGKFFAYFRTFVSNPSSVQFRNLRSKSFLSVFLLSSHSFQLTLSLVRAAIYFFGVVRSRFKLWLFVLCLELLTDIENCIMDIVRCFPNLFI